MRACFLKFVRFSGVLDLRYLVSRLERLVFSLRMSVVIKGLRDFKEQEMVFSGACYLKDLRVWKKIELSMIQVLQLDLYKVRMTEYQQRKRQDQLSSQLVSNSAHLTQLSHRSWGQSWVGNLVQLKRWLKIEKAIEKIGDQMVLPYSRMGLVIVL